MALSPGPDLSSVFDDMLALNKKRLDELSVRRQPPTRDSPADSANPSQPPAPDSAIVRRLNERFGTDWRYEIAERQRDGDEAIVLCRLTFGKDGAVRTQFGRARIGAEPVAGASGGVRFKLDAAGVGADEDDAFRRATEAALGNCLDLV
jgi:hypothetical protein